MEDFKHKHIIFVGLGMLFALIMVFGINILFEEQNRSVHAQPIAVGLIITPSGLEDLSFNWMSYQGLLRAENELGVVGTVYTTTSDADYDISLQKCLADNNGLCIAVGFAMMGATLNAAQTYPETAFAIVDVSYDSYPSNLRGLIFASSEASYLAGVLAGQMTKSNLIAAIGGMPIPTVNEYIFGYQTGAQCVNPNVQVVITYTNDFANPTLGAQVSQDLIQQGVDVILSAAGGSGTGALLTASLLGSWVIGVDSDQFVSVFISGTIPGSEKILTSAVKHIDLAVYQTVADVVEGTFTSGTRFYTLADGGVGLAPFHKTEASIPVHVKTDIEMTKQGILSGLIDPFESCGRYIYLPCMVKEMGP